jgi:hypothetical protein
MGHILTKLICKAISHLILTSYMVRLHPHKYIVIRAQPDRKGGAAPTFLSGYALITYVRTVAAREGCCRAAAPLFHMHKCLIDEVRYSY